MRVRDVAARALTDPVFATVFLGSGLLVSHRDQRRKEMRRRCQSGHNAGLSPRVAVARGVA